MITQDLPLVVFACTYVVRFENYGKCDIFLRVQKLSVNRAKLLGLVILAANYI